MTEPVADERVPAPRTSVEKWLSEKAGVEISDTPAGRVIQIPPQLAQRVNLLVPASQVVQVDRNYSPIPRIVQLDVEADSYVEQWHSKPAKRKRALNAKALGKLASLAGIEKVREDFDWMDGTGVKATVTGRQRGPDGTWKVNQASKVVRFARLERKVRREAIEQREKLIARARDEGWDPERIPVALTDDDLEKRIDDEMEHIDQKVTTKAWSRVIRSLLSLPATFTEAAAAQAVLHARVGGDARLHQPARRARHRRQLPRGQPRPVRRRGRAGRAARRGGHRRRARRRRARRHRRDPRRRGHRGPTTTPEPEGFDDPDDDEDPGDDPEPDEPGDEAEDFDEQGAFDMDLGPGAPPRPSQIVRFREGPHQGLTVDAVIEDPEGRVWVAERAAKMRASQMRDNLIAWLSWAEGRELELGDLAGVAQAARDAA